jgi:hypothetical protein
VLPRSVLGLHAAVARANWRRTDRIIPHLELARLCPLGCFLPPRSPKYRSSQLGSPVLLLVQVCFDWKLRHGLQQKGRQGLGVPPQSPQPLQGEPHDWRTLHLLQFATRQTTHHISNRPA